MKKTLGVLGGMGPQASARFYDLLIKLSEDLHGAKKNKDYPHILLSNLPVPDLINNRASEDETVKMVHDEAMRLRRAGADMLVMSCNTMHLFEAKISRKNTAKPFYSMIDAVIERVIKNKHKTVGLLGTRTTLTSGLYSDALREKGVNVLLPDVKEYKEIVKMINSVIAGKITINEKNKLKSFVNNFKKQGATAVILGCTELPLIAEQSVYKDIEIIDSLKILAEKATYEIYGNHSRHRITVHRVIRRRIR